MLEACAETQEAQLQGRSEMHEIHIDLESFGSMLTVCYGCCGYETSAGVTGVYSIACSRSQGGAQSHRDATCQV